MSTPQVQTPAPRNLTSELLQTYKGQAQTAQPYFNLESIFDPKYGQIQLGNLQQQLFGYNVPPGGPSTTTPGSTTTVPTTGVGKPKGGGGAGGINDPYAGVLGPSQTPGYHPGTLQLGAASNTFQRGADIGDVAKYGPAATGAFLNANPFLASGLTNLLTRTQDSPILQLLNSNALAGLKSQGQLSPQEIRGANQTAREADASRGLLTSSPSAVAEVLNRDALVRQRQAAANQFASGVQGLNQNQADLVGRASQIFSTTLSDPFQAILGRPSGAASGGTGGYPQQIGTGARLFDPMNPYAQDLYNTNFNAQAAANIANANSQAATQNAAIGAGGSLLAGLLPLLFTSDERLKKDIRKTGEKTPEGIPIKTFRYKTDALSRRLIGVMAQDVEKVKPGAVVTDPITGAKAVNYSMIAAPFNFVTGELRKAA